MKIRLVVLTAFSAVLIGLAVPNEFFHTGQPVLGLFCLVPFFLALYLCEDKRFSHLLGVIYGSITTVFTYYWLMFFGEFSVWTITGVTVGYAGYCFFLAPFLHRLFRVRVSWRPFVLAAAWTVYEYFKSSGYLAFPWGLIAYPVSDFLPLIQIADIVGVYGISYIMALANLLLVETLIRILQFQNEVLKFPAAHFSNQGVGGKIFLMRQWGVFAALTIAALFYGYGRMAMEIPVEKTFTTVLVQQNIDSWLSGNEMKSIRVGQDLTRAGIKELGKTPDIVIWSESSFRRPYGDSKKIFEKRPKDDPFIPFLRETGTYFLVGSPYVLDWENMKVMNSVLLIDPQAEVADFYGKQHPVPLAEHIPFYDEIELIRRFYTNAIGLPGGGWTLGEESKILSIPLQSGETLNFGTPICFEDAFPPLCRAFILGGADVLINLTNDSWSQTVSAEIQHMVVAKFRSVESKRTLIRSTNAGVTTVIGPYGEHLATLPLFVEDKLPMEVPVFKEQSLTDYMLLGDYFPYILIALLLFTLAKQSCRKRV